MFYEFFPSGKFMSNLNFTFISFILRKVNAEHMGDSWPISLVGCIYKSLSKTLAHRLRGVIEDLISRNQIRGRYIHEQRF